MDSARMLVTLGGGALVAFTLYFFFGERETKTPAESAADRTLYRCPMHPWITGSAPGACSICGMEMQRDNSVESAQE